jgi:hypothetical protein
MESVPARRRRHRHRHRRRPARLQPEAFVETYYALRIASRASLTADVQVVANPAYNSDRGPVPIYALRLHVER